jgi:hypothetical protein
MNREKACLEKKKMNERKKREKERGLIKIPSLLFIGAERQTKKFAQLLGGRKCQSAHRK